MSLNVIVLIRTRGAKKFKWRSGFLSRKSRRQSTPRSRFHPQAAPLQLGNKTPSDVPEEILQKIRADVWADGTPGRAKTADPVVVKLRPGAQVPKLKQPPLKRDVKEGIKPLINTFLKYQLIQPCISPHITLLFCQYKTWDWRVSFCAEFTSYQPNCRRYTFSDANLILCLQIYLETFASLQF